jgi:hypothetical protein
MTRSNPTSSNTQWGLDCSAAAAPGSRVDLIEIPLDHPEKAHLAGWLPTGGTGNGCHDVNVYEELHLVALACPSGNQATLLDVSDIKNPQILWTFTYPGISTMHTAGFTYSGKYVLVDAEPGGGSNAECDYNDDQVKYTLFIINRFNGQLVGQFHLPHPQATALVPPEGGVVEPTYCTLHELNTAPFIDRDIVASSCYNCGRGRPANSASGIPRSTPASTPACRRRTARAAGRATGTTTRSTATSSTTASTSGP